MKKINKQSGFSLVELLVAISIFSLFIVMTTGALSNILRTERKLSALRSTQENCRYIIESIVREARGANGELDSGGVREEHAYSILSGELIITSTDMNMDDPELGRVNQSVYSLVDGEIVKKNYFKGITESDYTLDSEFNITDLNEITISDLTFEIPENPLNMFTPPLLKLSITAENTRGVDSGKDDQTAKIVIETSVSPRNY